MASSDTHLSGSRALTLADAEYLGATDRAYALSRWPAILEGDLLRVLDLPFCPTLEAIRLHCLHSFPDSLPNLLASRIADEARPVNPHCFQGRRSRAREVDKNTILVFSCNKERYILYSGHVQSSSKD